MTTDEKYMRRALQLARQGYGHTSPNPMVGAVLVHDGTVIGEGFHRRCGHAHAEVNAIAAVRDRALLPHSTLYVTLEPCSHYGKTPPCAKLVIDSRIPRVVVGCADPNPLVAGRGIAMLREAGVEVITGVLEDECRSLNHRFITAHSGPLPHVLLKWAQSADGFIARADGSPVAFSTPLTAALMHRRRAGVDAIVVGARTVATDNPSLTTRLWPGNSPLRVILDRNLSIPAHSRVLTDGRPTLVLNASLNRRNGNTEWLCAHTDQPRQWLTLLRKRGITSLMVEGGAGVLQQMIAAGAWHEMRVETVPITLGGGVPAPAVNPCQAAHTITIDNNTIHTFINRPTSLRAASS